MKTRALQNKLAVTINRWWPKILAVTATLLWQTLERRNALSIAAALQIAHVAHK